MSGSIFRAAAVWGACLLMAGTAWAASYTDSTNDGDIFQTFPHLDISGVDVTNTATHISFDIHLVGSPIVTNWGEYQISIDSIAGGTTSGTVPPNRPVSMSSGMDYYIRSWHSGAELYRWEETGPYWALDHATWQGSTDISTPSKTFFTVNLTTTLASLGLSNGDSFAFDVWSSGGTPTDSAVDALANPLATAAGNDWVSAYDAGNNVFHYTVVPEPASLALGVLGLATLLTRRGR